jgi:hypothetical protein
VLGRDGGCEAISGSPNSLAQKHYYKNGKTRASGKNRLISIRSPANAPKKRKLKTGAVDKYVAKLFIFLPLNRIYLYS